MRSKVRVLIKGRRETLEALTTRVLDETKRSDVGVLHGFRDADAVGPRAILRNHILQPPKRPPHRHRILELKSELLGVAKRIQEGLSLVRGFLGTWPFGSMEPSKAPREHFRIVHVGTKEHGDNKSQSKLGPPGASDDVAVFIMFARRVKASRASE